MTKQKLMPGVMSKSPTTGELQAQIKMKNPIGTRGENLNQNLILAPQNTEAQAITQNRQSTLAELDEAWGNPNSSSAGRMSRMTSTKNEPKSLSVKVTKTDTGKGLDRPIAGGDRSKEVVRTSSASQDIGDAKSSDQPGEGGDQGNENPIDMGTGETTRVADPQVASSVEKDAQGTEDHPGPTEIPINMGLSTPAFNTSDASTNEIEGLLKTSDDDPADPTVTIPGKSPDRNEGQLDLKIITEPTVLPQSQERVAQSELKPERSVKGTNQTDQDQIPRREFLRPKTISPPLWRRFPEWDRSIYLRRFQGTGCWSALEFHDSQLLKRKAEGSLRVNDLSYHDSIRYWRDQPPLRINIPTPKKPVNDEVVETCQGHSHPKLSAPLRGSNRPLLTSTEPAW